MKTYILANKPAILFCEVIVLSCHLQNGWNLYLKVNNNSFSGTVIIGTFEEGPLTR